MGALVIDNKKYARVLANVSDVVNAKRAISKVDARQLAEFFKVSANLFI